jgi:hypothetical protein
VHWSVGPLEGKKEFSILIPQKVFDGLMNEVAKRGGHIGIGEDEESIEYNGAKLYEFMAGELTPGDDFSKWLEEGRHPDNFKIVLEYDDQKHIMWAVTFHYVFQNWSQRNIKYHLRETWWCLRAAIPWWINPRYWFK